MSQLGDAIFVARTERDLTLRGLAKISGVSNPLICQIETGKVRDPRFSTIVRIAKALELSLPRLALLARP